MKLIFNYIKQIIIFFSFLVIIALNSCANKSEQILSNNKMQPIVRKEEKNKEIKTIENQFNKNIKDEKTIQIAALLPNFGEYALLGSQMFNLIKIGVEDSGCNYNINYSLYNGADYKSITEAAPNILTQNTDIIVGPIFSKLIANLNMQINESIPIVSFSNDESILINKNINQEGNYDINNSTFEIYQSAKIQNIYLFGHKPLKQSEKIIQFILNEKSKDIILLLPEPRNNNLINFLNMNITSNKGQILKIISYNSKDTESIIKAIQEIKDTAEKNNNSDNLKIGVYIADNKNGLTALLKQIKQFNLDKMVNLFGDNRLDSNFYHNIDMYYTGSLNAYDRLSDIMTGAEFNYMHKLAYDIGLMLGKVIQDIPNLNKITITNALKNTNWLKGSSGYFKMQNHITIRKYDILRNINNKVIKIKSLD
ncbi:MAG: hypothetical protein U1E31_02600 [Rickettsiales bacterium]